MKKTVASGSKLLVEMASLFQQFGVVIVINWPPLFDGLGWHHDELTPLVQECGW